MLGIVHLAGAALLPQPSVTFRRDAAPPLHLPYWKHKRLARGPQLCQKEKVNISVRRQALLAYSGVVRPWLSGPRNILSVRKASHPKISKYQLEFQRLFFSLSLSFFFSLGESVKPLGEQRLREPRRARRGRKEGFGGGGVVGLASEWPTLPHRRALQTDRHPHSTMWHGAMEPSPAARGV